MSGTSQQIQSGLFQQSPGIEVAPLQDEVILFHPSTAKFFVLNRTSSFIWSSLREPASLQQITEKIQSNFKSSDKFDVTVDVGKVLQEMHSQGLITKIEN